MSIEQLNIKIRKSLKGHNAKVLVLVMVLVMVVMLLVMVVLGGGIGAVDDDDVH